MGLVFNEVYPESADRAKAVSCVLCHLTMTGPSGDTNDYGTEIRDFISSAIAKTGRKRDPNYWKWRSVVANSRPLLEEAIRSAELRPVFTRLDGSEDFRQWRQNHSGWKVVTNGIQATAPADALTSRIEVNGDFIFRMQFALTRITSEGRLGVEDVSYPLKWHSNDNNSGNDGQFRAQKDCGEFNSVEVEAVGDIAKVRLNGVEVLVSERKRNRISTPIFLECVNQSIELRFIRIRQIEIDNALTYGDRIRNEELPDSLTTFKDN